MFEYHCVKNTILACVKNSVGQDGQVENIRLYLKNLRLSAAYWRTSLIDLIAQIRCLGQSTHIVTFSCNDVNWWNMSKALLIPDERLDFYPQDYDIRATQILIKKYSPTLRRHFMVLVVKALMKFIRSNHEVLGGQVVNCC